MSTTTQKWVMPSVFTTSRIKQWNVEFNDGTSMILAGSHPTMIYHYIKTFWPEKEIKKIAVASTGQVFP
jgi:hypothetical protein